MHEGPHGILDLLSGFPFRSGKGKQAAHSHEHPHPHPHEHKHADAHPHPHGHPHPHEHQHAPGHEPHEHKHGHYHADADPQEHDHERSHDHGHTSDNAHEAHTHSTSGLAGVVRLWMLPGALLALILLSLIPAASRMAGFDLALIPMLLGGIRVSYNTVRAVVKTRRITAGVLVVLALIGTAYVGEFAAGAVVALMMIAGETLEEMTLEKTRNAVRELIRLAPERAEVLRDGQWVEVSTEEVDTGDRVLIRPGGRIPVDGSIAFGQASINQATLTGESMPVDRTVGEQAFVGTIVESGSIEVVAEKVGADTTLGRIIRVVFEAQERKGTTQRVADRFATYFTPVILLICAAVWLVTRDLMRVMAVLVIACPCALVLATPTAVVAAVGNAARRGALIKGGDVIEQAGKVDTLLLDKTGTVTLGQPEVLDITPFGDVTGPEVLALAASAEDRSEHPIGKTVVSKARELVVHWAAPTEFEQLFGTGVRAVVDGVEILVGNQRVLESAPLPQFEALEYISRQEQMGRSPLIVLRGGRAVGGLAVADKVRTDARQALDRLKRAGVSSVALVTGDNAIVAAAVAREIGIDEVHSAMMPEDKLRLVQDLRRQGRVVGMVGDGVNDAPALVSADLGIAMGAAGTDVAIESAGIALMGDSLVHLAHVLALSRRTLSIIRQNIWVFAVGVNIVGIALASSGLLTPVWAAVVHNASSVFVVLNSARLLGYGEAASG